MIRIIDPPSDTDDLENGVDASLPTWFKSVLRDNGYNWDITGHKLAVNIKRDDEDTGYHLFEIETTTVPFEQADVVADATHMVVCQCPSQLFHHGPENPGETIEDLGLCKHGEAAREKSARAMDDEDQTTL